MAAPGSAACSPARMTHVAVRCRDIDASIDFYRRYAGLLVVHDREDNGVRVAWIAHRRESPSFVMVLMHMPYEDVREPCAMDHFGFDVGSREQVDRIGELARAEGTLKLGPLYAGPIVGYIALVRDPSGNTCEFSHGQSIQPDPPS
jgi:catechol 2,3-dioxygenase-like lactoylglutathione lyase family enzyme